MTELAIIVLEQDSVPLARRIAAAVPEARLYGPPQRPAGVDIAMTDLGETLRSLFRNGTPIVGLCAAGTLIHSLAPLLGDARQAPPVLVVSADGGTIVPLVGEHRGADRLARQIADGLRLPSRMSAGAHPALGDETRSTPTAAGSDTAAATTAVDATAGSIACRGDDRARGWLAIVGTGPGAARWMSPEVRDVLQAASDWVGYSTYLNLAEPLRQGQRRHDFDNREEIERASMALDLAAEGRTVALVSSGDPGIYAMAAAVFEVLERDDKPAWQHVDIQVCPGISAMQAAAAHVGAPLGHDFCVISLSDILKPWTIIEQRIAAAAQADFVLVFYNPVSKQRTWQLDKAKQIIMQWRSPETPVILGRDLGRPRQEVMLKPLAQLSAADADMRTILLVGSRQTRSIRRPDGRTWVYTLRRYAESGSPRGALV